MNKTGFTIISLFVIAAVFLSGCTSPPSAPAPAPSTSDTEYNLLVLSPEELPQGLVRAVDGPMLASDVTDTMREYGWQRGYRVLFADTIPLTDKSKVLTQDIMIFNGANATVMLDEHQKSLEGVNTNDVTALRLPDPELGEKSFAVKVTSTGPRGAETYYYVFGFAQSGIYEVISIEGTPATYPELLQIAKRAADKVRK